MLDLETDFRWATQLVAFDNVNIAGSRSCKHRCTAGKKSDEELHWKLAKMNGNNHYSNRSMIGIVTKIICGKQ